MGPVKFDDIHKTANEVLSDDYQTSGYSMKAKQKTSLDGAVVTTQVDLFPGKDSVQTPAKVTWKFPKPMSFEHVCVDKLEMDKTGKFKLECSSSAIRPDLKLEAKSDLVDPAKITSSFTFTGIPDTQVKFETKLADPGDFSLEATRVAGLATLGVKFGKANITKPDIGARILSGPLFGSIFIKEKFSALTAHSFYKASDVLKIAGTYELGGKKNGSFSVGAVYDVSKDAKFKAKVQQDQSLSTTLKYSLSKGFTILAGGKYEIKSGNFSYGAQLSIE